MRYIPGTFDRVLRTGSVISILLNIGRDTVGREDDLRPTSWSRKRSADETDL
jgi:hypothetical protein